MVRPPLFSGMTWSPPGGLALHCGCSVGDVRERARRNPSRDGFLPPRQVVAARVLR